MRTPSLLTGSLRTPQLRLTLLAISAFLAFLFTTNPVSAQSVTGFPPLGSFANFGPDTLNLFNFNDHVTIPVFHKAGRGMPFEFVLNYDSTVWSPGSTWAYSGAWKGGVPGIGGSFSFFVYAGFPGHPQCPETTAYYTDSFGTVHVFSSNVAKGTICGPLTATSGAQDGSGYQLTLQGTDGSGQTLPPIVLALHDRSGNSVGTSITDQNGNSITWNTTNGTYTDTLGMTVVTVTSSTNATTYTYTGPNSTQESVTVNYSSYMLKTNFGCSGITEYGPTATNLVSSIALPDGTAYGIKYEPTPGFSGDVTGRISEIDLPTGGSIQFQYVGGSNGINCTDGTATGINRTTSDGTWTYTRNTSAETTTILDPAGNQTVVTFAADPNHAGHLEVQRSIYQGTSTLVETITNCYNNSAAPCTTATNSSLYGTPAAITTIHQLAGGKSTQTVTYNEGVATICPFYCTFRPTEIDRYDFGASSPTQVKKIAYASFSSGEILDHPACVQTTAGADSSSCGTVTSNTLSLANLSYFSNGNLQEVSSWVTGSTYLNRSFTYFSNGLLETATDVNSNHTTYGYQTCNSAQAYLSSVSSGVLTRSFTWDCNGGVVTQVTDANGNATSYGYLSQSGAADPFWRVSSLTDPLGNVTRNVFTPAAGSNPATSETFLNFPNSSPTSTVDRLTTFDGLGRIVKSQKRTAPGATTFDNEVTYTYGWDSTGRTTTQTVVGGSANTTTQLDGLGRIVSVTDGGGGTLTLSYSQNDVLIARGPAPSGENTKQRQMEYDSLGRLVSVCEITSTTGSGTCGQSNAETGYWTKYTYDALGDLVTVTQNAQAASGSQQHRSYVYDGLRRITSETNPETGTTTYTYDSDSTCTPASDGDLVKRVDPVGNTTCYQYDALHRATAITYSGPYAGSTPNKYFVYDSATVNSVVMSFAKTHLAEAYTATSSTGTKITDVGLSYSKRGELTDVYESTPHSSGYNHTNAQFWANGALNVLTGPGIPTMTYAPDGEGRLKTISASSGQNPVTATTYNTASQPTAVTLGSNDSDAFQYDSNTLRQTQYKFNVGSQSVTGNLGWNANGSLGSLNITDAFDSSNTQNCSFSADDLSRIATANCGAIWGQSFSYDAFGNISKQVLSGSAGTTFQPTYAASPSITNQIATLPGNVHPTYDANGNSLNDSFRTYTWDADNRPVSVNGSAVALTYDALGRMVEQARGTSYTQIVYSPLGSKIATMNGATLQKGFVPLTSGASAIYNSSGLAYYRHADYLGSSRFASTPTQTLYSDTAYSAFGEPYAQSGTTDASFTGQDQDTVPGVYDFLFRKDDPAQSRWTSPDPAGLAAVDPTDPQSWNRYAYVRSNPLSNIDPTGLFCAGPQYALHDCGGFWGNPPWGSTWSEFDVLTMFPGRVSGSKFWGYVVQDLQGTGEAFFIYGGSGWYSDSELNLQAFVSVPNLFTPPPAPIGPSPNPPRPTTPTPSEAANASGATSTTAQLPDSLTTLLEAQEKLELFVTNRVLIPGAMILGGLTVAGASVIATAGLCSTGVGCLASPITATGIVGGLALAGEGVYYGINQKFLGP